MTAFSIHGVSLAIEAPDQVLRAVQRRLRHFAAPAPNSIPPDLVFRVRRLPQLPTAPASMRPVYESSVGEVLYAEDTDQLFLQAGADVRVVVDAASGTVETAVRGAIAPQVWLLSHPLLTLPLIELLKRRGLFSVHAAGLALDGRGLLLAGTSGAGKSTLALASLRAGFQFLGDDILFLATGAEGMRLHAFPDEIDLTQQTARFFPELASVLDVPRPLGWPKWSVLAEAAYPGQTISTACTPSVLVFPQIASCTRSTLAPLAPDEALIELAPNVLLTQPADSARHFAVLAELVRTCRAYRLYAGRDFLHIARMLRQLTVEQA